jgi:hypothetical protein
MEAAARCAPGLSSLAVQLWAAAAPDPLAIRLDDGRNAAAARSR